VPLGGIHATRPSKSSPVEAIFDRMRSGRGPEICTAHAKHSSSIHHNYASWPPWGWSVAGSGPMRSQRAFLDISRALGIDAWWGLSPSTKKSPARDESGQRCFADIVRRQGRAIYLELCEAAREGNRAFVVRCCRCWSTHPHGMHVSQSTVGTRAREE
jgi:hypothetical protein